MNKTHSKTQKKATKIQGAGVVGPLLESWREWMMPDALDQELVQGNARLASLYIAMVLTDQIPATVAEKTAVARLAYQRAGVMPETAARIASVKAGKDDDGKLEVIVTFERKPLPTEADDEG